MNLTELLQVLWRRKLVVLATFLSVMALAALALAAQAKVYEATSTLNLTPVARDDVFLLGQMNVIVPIYAAGANTAQTYNIAAEKLGGFEDLGKVSVRTFRDSTIIKIVVRHGVPARAVAAAQAMTDAMLERVGRGELGLSQLQLEQIDQPRLPTEPVSPRPGLTFAVAMVLGLGFGVGAAIVRDSLGRRIDTATDLSQVVGAPCFSEVPTVRALGRATSAKELHAVVFDGQNAALAEAFRDLHTNLQFTEGNVRSILITSPDGRHGKTTIAASLAMTIARAGARTVLVDGDIRRGRVGAIFGRQDSLGLFDVFGGAPLEDAVRPSGVDKLDVLPAGRRTEDADEALDKHFLPVLQRLESRYDAVVIDGPPVVPVNDARIMARYADATVLVAAAGALARRHLRTAVERLTIISVHPRACVLNHSKARPSASSLAYLRAWEDTSQEFPEERLGHATGLDGRQPRVGGAASPPGGRGHAPPGRLPPEQIGRVVTPRPPVGGGLRQNYARHPAAGTPSARARRDEDRSPADDLIGPRVLPHDAARAEDENHEERSAWDDRSRSATDDGPDDDRARLSETALGGSHGADVPDEQLARADDERVRAPDDEPVVTAADAGLRADEAIDGGSPRAEAADDAGLRPDESIDGGSPRAEAADDEPVVNADDDRIAAQPPNGHVVEPAVEGGRLER